MTIENWDGTQNCVMKGYILYAVREWNANYPDQRIDHDTVEHLMQALGWATDDLTADEAYRFYNTH